jgi:protein phosphatase 1 regulatory subunit 11
MAYLATQRRPGTSAPGDGSRTITITPTPANEEGGSAEEGSGGVNEGGEPPSTIVGALHLRGGARRTRARVAWDEDVVDNEGCGRKSSKSACSLLSPPLLLCEEYADWAGMDSLLYLPQAERFRRVLLGGRFVR